MRLLSVIVNLSTQIHEINLSIACPLLNFRIFPCEKARMSIILCLWGNEILERKVLMLLDEMYIKWRAALLRFGGWDFINNLFVKRKFFVSSLPLVAGSGRESC